MTDISSLASIDDIYYESNDEYTLIQYATFNINQPFALTPLLKKDIRGKINIWQVQFDGKDLSMLHGCVDGAIRRERREIKTNSSNRDNWEQGLLEAKSRYKKKYDSGYTSSLTIEGFKSPQLAREYTGKQIKHWPVMVEPKLDGIRMLGINENGSVKCLSRQNKEFIYFEHIKFELLILFQYLPPEVRTDGELYNKLLTFEHITSITSTKKTRHPDHDYIQYHIYDLMMFNTPAEERYEILLNAYNMLTFEDTHNLAMHVLKQYIPIKGILNIITQYNPPIKYLFLVDAALAQSHEDIEVKHDEYVKQGYEGIMIRKISHDKVKPEETYYTTGRNNNLLKYKKFKDAEAKILDIISAEGNQTDVAVFCVEDCVTNVKFNVAMKGTLEEKRNYYRNKADYIGKIITYKYQEWTVDGVPRFPVAYRFRNE